MSKTTMTIPFAADPGDGENHWIRLEQVRKPDEGVTMAQAAALIDAMYGIEPCEDGMGNGGEAADEEALPEEEDFLEMAREMLDLDICDETEPLTWDAEVDVFRSHQEDSYNLQGELIEVGEVTPMSRSVTEVVDVGGNSHDLTWPCAGGVSVSGAGATVRDVRGSTVNFTASVRGRVRISYTAVWDRVKLKVRRFAMPDLSGGVSIERVMAVAGGDTGKKREDDAASVVAFWRDLAAECALTRPPEDDQGIDQAEIERLCNRQTDWQVVGDCWKRVETFNLCNCSGLESPEQPEPEDVDAPCPEGVRPDSFLGVERKQGEYVDCPGEDKEGLNTEEFFRDHCCEEKPYSPLPRCRVTWEENKGGAEIEGGPEYWKSVYGENVRLTPVTPEGGRCGEIIRKWNVPGEIGGPPELPEKIAVDAGKTFSVSIIAGGVPPFTWSVPTGVTYLGDAAMGFIGLFRAEVGFRGGVLTVTDACKREASCSITATNCYWWPWDVYGPDGKSSPYAKRYSFKGSDFPDSLLQRIHREPEEIDRYNNCEDSVSISASFAICEGISEDKTTYCGFYVVMIDEDQKGRVPARLLGHNDIIDASVAKCKLKLLAQGVCRYTSRTVVDLNVGSDTVTFRCKRSTGEVGDEIKKYWFAYASGRTEYICD